MVDVISRRFRYKAFGIIGIVIALNILLFLALIQPTPSTPPAYAQDGSGNPEDKEAPIDGYPLPFSEGAMPFSLRDPWDKTDLTFYFHNCPSTLSCEVGRDAVREGFRKWEAVSALKFTEVSSVSQADIEITWTTEEEGLGTPGDVLAFAYFPRYGGDMYIDDVEDWRIGDGSDLDLVLVATHEIGHAVGLGHSEFRSAIMYAYSGFAGDLGQDDIDAIQSLYGPPDTVETPSPSNNTPGITGFPIPRLDANTFQANGSITEADPYNVWTVRFEAGDTVNVNLSSIGGNLDPYLGILNQDQSAVLVENGDNDGDRVASVAYTFDQDGTYLIVATRFGVWDGSSTGSYTLTVKVASDETTPTTPNNVPSNPQGITWRVTNYADTAICYIYFSASDSDSWGEDQLGNDQLSDNTYYEWQIDAGTYDISVWDCNDNSLEQYRINASRDVDIQVYQDRILVVPLLTTTTTGATDAPSADQFVWRISNYKSNVPICAIYFSPTINDDWGSNQLEGGRLNTNYYIEWQLEANTYDIRIEDCSGQALEKRNVTLTQDVEIQILDENILVETLGDPLITENAPSTFRWRVSNYTDFTLCRVYFSQTNSQGWGVNQLGNSPLDAGYYIEFEIEPATYDIRVEDCNGGFLESFNITLTQNTEIQVNSNAINVTPLP